MANQKPYIKWEGTKDPTNSYGFVYQISHKKTGEYYIGSKVYWSKKPPAQRRHKQARSTVLDPAFRDNHRESDWKIYRSSSTNKAFKLDVGENPNSYKYEIIYNANSKGELNTMERFYILYNSWYLTDDLCLNKFSSEFKKPFGEAKESIINVIQREQPYE